MKQNLSESFLLHFCTEMSQKSWNFHRQFHFLQCNSIRKMKRNSPWAPEYLVTLIGFPFYLWKKCFFILQGSCKDSFPFPSFPYLTHYGPLIPWGAFTFWMNFNFFVDRQLGDDSCGISNSCNWNSIDFYIQMNICKGFFDTWQDNLVETRQK